MEKISIFDLGLKERENIDLPRVFLFKPRKDLINKATEVLQTKNKQTQGRDPRAGLKNTAESWATGHGLSRAPRLKGSGYPTARNVGRVPFARGGRVAHPVRAEKIIKKRINKKTNILGLISAIAASADTNWILERGHIINSIPQLPFVVDDKIQTIKKTNKLFSTLCDLGLKEELSRVKNMKKIRAGKGKRRGRKYKRKKGPLIVIKNDFGIVKAARNIPGLNIVNVDKLSINHVAPGGQPGRFIIWTQSSFKDLNKFNELIK